MNGIPIDVRNLVIELNTDQNDGYTQKGCRDQLQVIHDYIGEALADSKGRFKGS